MCFDASLKRSRFKSFAYNALTSEPYVCFELLQLSHVRPKQSSSVGRKVRLRVFPEALCVLSGNLKAPVSNRFSYNALTSEPYVCFELLQLRHVRPKQSSSVGRKVRLRVLPEALIVLSENLKALFSILFY